MAKKLEIVSAACDTCGGGARNHEVLYSHVETWGNDEAAIWGSTTYQVIKCRGCDEVRFRTFSFDNEHYDPEDGQQYAYGIHLYPESTTRKSGSEIQLSDDNDVFPEDVRKMYLETIKCMNASAYTLSGGGLRAIVEAICKDKSIKGRSLEAKIDTLVVDGYLAKVQANLLHEERYIGNSALHEMKTPSKRDLEDGLKIVEGLLSAIYVLPLHAERLRKKRTAQPKKLPPPKSEGKP